jgi:hypothetical protein
MATKLGIYNDALLALGAERLASLTEAATARYALDDAYAGTLSFCLEQGLWNFAMRTVALSSSPSIVPSFGYRYAVEKPDDWVRTYGISADENFTTPLLRYQDENGLWYANVDPLYARYVSSDTAWGGDLSLWPETYADYVARRLATRIHKRVTGGDPTEEFKHEVKRALASARSKDAMNEPPAFPPMGSWALSRGGSSNYHGR